MNFIIKGSSVAIGAHGGSYSIYHALAVASKNIGLCFSDFAFLSFDFHSKSQYNYCEGDDVRLYKMRSQSS